MKKLSALLFLAAIALAGCKEDQPVEVVQTVDWYKAHDAERIEMVKKCKNSPGEIAGTTNCINAKSAHDQTIFGSQNFNIKATPPKFTR